MTGLSWPGGRPTNQRYSAAAAAAAAPPLQRTDVGQQNTEHADQLDCLCFTGFFPAHVVSPDSLCCAPSVVCELVVQVLTPYQAVQHQMVSSSSSAAPSSTL
eukprot:GHRQ01027614.1.p1 GENE.GHRQ01027614.1~~GHRQ01027614.1.p1  ORF type:complete len:102 (+),score=21.16 GHRQ01027614.1:267-572(+)